ncbi:unnamed protein product [Cladocopium goreaui]|uniref:Pseudouridine synthase RsuA/RluA-like domain-containing protein n=1 Tax=Cladocopium goreaui TaxID=2562237 RepID=A0A9P1DFN6_9DINO|nr:unnamed protein product [Cladocopium goreaui]
MYEKSRTDLSDALPGQRAPWDDEAVEEVRIELGGRAKVQEVKDMLAAEGLQPWISVSQYHPVGRLDRDTTGLLLFSRDGVLTSKLLAPTSEVPRCYEAVVQGDATKPLGVGGATLEEKLGKGVITQEGIFDARLLGAECIEKGKSKVTLEVSEGKYRMVRKMLYNCGHAVLELHRVSYGALQLGDLEVGCMSFITPEEAAWAKDLVAPSDNTIDIHVLSYSKVIDNAGDKSMQVKYDMSMKNQMYGKSGDFIKGRELFAMILISFKSPDHTEVLYNAHHLYMFSYYGDDQLEAFYNKWLDIIYNMKHGDRPSMNSLRDTLFRKIEHSKLMHFDISRYRTFDEGHPEKTYDFLINMIKGYIARGKQERLLKDRERAVKISLSSNKTTPALEDDVKAAAPTKTKKEDAADIFDDKDPEEMTLEELIDAQPDHWRSGKAGDGKVYLNDDGEKVKLNVKGNPYKIGEDGRRLFKTSLRPKGTYSPEEWRKLSQSDRNVILKAEKKKLEKKEADEKNKRKVEEVKKKSLKKEKKDSRKDKGMPKSKDDDEKDDDGGQDDESNDGHRCGWHDWHNSRWDRDWWDRDWRRDGNWRDRDGDRWDRDWHDRDWHDRDWRDRRWS